MTNDWSASVPACKRRLKSGVKACVMRGLFASKNDAQGKRGRLRSSHYLIILPKQFFY